MSARKKGLAPNGLTTGKIVLTTKKIFLRISDNFNQAIRDLDKQGLCKARAAPVVR